VGVEKGGAAAGEVIKVGGLRERMAAKRCNPIVEIVDEDEEDIGPGRSPVDGGFGRESEGDGGDADREQVQKIHGERRAVKELIGADRVELDGSRLRTAEVRGAEARASESPQVPT
jgi:hypothetical protein